jgi:DNA-binding Xre family transcriptional regulator
MLVHLNANGCIEACRLETVVETSSSRKKADDMTLLSLYHIGTFLFLKDNKEFGVLSIHENAGQLRFNLRGALEDFEARTGIRLTYEALSQRTELSVDTIKSLASREDYNATLRNIASICDALKCNPLDYLIWTGQTEGNNENRL